ncbi:MAG TPA: protease pro-enzyme activation domain-containing protein [bacterium]|nr:protease pro-enzyme activation domain-containing protein [bacterium]
MSRSQFLILVLTATALTALAAKAEGQVLKGCLRPEFESAARVGDLDGSRPLDLDLGLPLPDPAGLQAFVATLYDPQSKNYHRYLDPQSFAARFGPSPQDYQALENFVRAQGLTVRATHSSRLLLEVRGRADRIEQVFHVTLGRRLRPDGSQFFAPDQDPSVDLTLPGLSVSGLDNFARRQRRSLRHPGPAQGGTRAQTGRAPRAGTGDDSDGAYQGQDFRDAYVPGVSLQGSGQNIGLVEFGGFYSQDISTYAATSNPPLPVTVVGTVLVDGFDGNPMDNGDGSASTGGPEGDCSEVSLDIELAMSMAPQAHIITYEAPFSASMSEVLAPIADDPVCNQISCSWGGGDMGSNAAALLLQLASQGQAFFNATGDVGAYGSGDVAGGVPGPDDLSPYITEVGGTNLNTGASTSPPISYASESTWNDYSGTCSGIVTGCGSCEGGVSGGGICDGSDGSNILDIPSYQEGISMSTNGGSTTRRNIPDVSAMAENYWVVYCDLCPAVVGQEGAGQQAAPFDGTSAATPLWAAFLALVNEQAASVGKAPLGFANPALYAVAKGSGYTADFHSIEDNSNNDVVSDSNTSCDSIYYTAVAGYNLATGWGSPKGAALIQALVGTIASPTISPTFSDSPTPTATWTASPSYTATPTFSDSPTPTPTFTASPSFTATPTFSDSPTPTPSFTASPSFTDSPTASPTPLYLSSGLGKCILAPNPARGGEAVTLYLNAQPSGTHWRVYTLAGRRIDELSIEGSGPHRFSTQGLSAGVYFAQITVNFSSGYTQSMVLKFAVIP